MLHHNNAPCHTAVSINKFLAEKSIPVVPQPPLQSLRLLFIPLAQKKGRNFGTLDNIQMSVTKLKGVPALLRTKETIPPSLRSCPSELF
jgi:hypothetical protein